MVLQIVQEFQKIVFPSHKYVIYNSGQNIGFLRVIKSPHCKVTPRTLSPFDTSDFTRGVYLKQQINYDADI